MTVLLIILVTLLVIAGLGVYLFFSVRSLLRSGKRGMEVVAGAGEKLTAPFSRYEALPNDEPIESPFLPERRAQAMADLRRVAAQRDENRAARLDRSQARWEQGIDPDRFDLDRARARWKEQKAL